MVNEKAVLNFQKYAAKNLKGKLAGTPTVYQGGMEVDHYKGLARTFAASLIPALQESYEPTEFIFGSLPLNDPSVPHLFFQIPLLKVKKENIPTVASFGAFAPVSIDETIVAPRLGFSNSFVPISAVPGGAMSSKAVAKTSVTASALVASLNASKAMRKASKPVSADAYVGSFYVKINAKSPIGSIQMAPYKGYTIITGQSAPAKYAMPDHPSYYLAKIYKKFRLVAEFLHQRQTRGQGVGQQVITNSNAAMMQLIFHQLDSIVSASASSGTPPVPRPRAA